VKPLKRRTQTDATERVTTHMQVLVTFISLSFIPVTCFIHNIMCYYRKARETIQRLVSKIQGGPLDNDDGGGGGGATTGQIELMVPGGKVGLIIGKSGETIKQIQVCINEAIVSQERVK